MDFPISVPSIGLVDGKFVDESPLTGAPGSLIPAQWGNAVTEEVLNAIVAAGLAPDENNNAQLVTAIRLLQKQPVLVADTGIANAYAAVNAPALSALPGNGYVQRIIIAHANTGASTYAPDGLSAKPIYGLALQPLQGGELPVGIAVLMYLVQAGVNGGNGAWIIIESLGGASQISPATKSQHAMQLGQATGRLINISSFTSSGTFTPNASTKILRVRGVGGGGSGGYSLATAAGQTSTGTGGDAGAFGEIWVTSGIGSTSISVGAGGVGAAGGQSSFGALLVCPGGAAGINGGAFAPPNQNVRTGAILQPSGTGIFVVKGAGNGGLNGISLSSSFTQGGSGGSTQYGGGGQGAINGVGGGGIGYGSGGGGATCLPSTGAQAGGNGAPGIVIVEEYS